MGPAYTEEILLQGKITDIDYAKTLLNGVANVSNVFIIYKREFDSMDSKIVVLFLATGLLFSVVLGGIMYTNSNAAYAQQIPIPISKPRSLKITYPTQDQQVSVDGNFTVKGMVNYGLATPLKGTAASNVSACHVIVQINQIPPYHIATGTGPHGQRDFSTWKYTVDTKSTPIKQGPDNKIYARLSCPQSPNLETRVVTTFTGVAGTNSTASGTNSTAS